MVTALANLAVERNDDALKAVLTEHGFNITPPAGAGRAPSTPPATQPGRGERDNRGGGASRLAQQGNTNAAMIVDQLAKRGVTIKP